MSGFIAATFTATYTITRDFYPTPPINFIRWRGGAARRRDTIGRVADWTKVEQVGEIGCGAGWNLWSFHQDGKKVTGADYSVELTDSGRAMGMDIRQGSFEELDGISFDVLIISHVLEHMPDPLAALKKAADMLSANGLLYVEVPDARDVCLGMFQGAHLWYFTPTRLRALAAQSGLEVIDEQSYNGVHFSLTFRQAVSVETPDLSGEFKLMRDIILRFERRERFKDLLRRLGVFKLARWAYSIIRR